ncbi:hypothetical protein B0T26DRAFT_752508 [Lasiosphaeria miniovina]|uniref:Uncharacterized protein n=1 Tax=Lasiosphaeria miniovina TaxID=1954250 RepID=A0AA40AMU4_9PEZI|nr:uncharacterized protein B0T26DRAFT_752508 [Lasiosphaeria miniovina]KAK0718602.1 hypothetical protein B0T26DRAFT_752508 [Lasiosphaeria miniovina]
MCKAHPPQQELPVKGGYMNFVASTYLDVALNTSLDTPTDTESAFLTLQLPEQHINHQTDVPIPAQRANVSNKTQITAWFNE